MKKLLSLLVTLVFLVSIVPAFGGAQGKVNTGRKSRKAVKDFDKKTEGEWERLEAEMGDFATGGKNSAPARSAGTGASASKGSRSQ
jgi:hypothetical protein